MTTYYGKLFYIDAWFIEREVLVIVHYKFIYYIGIVYIFVGGVEGNYLDSIFAL